MKHFLLLVILIGSLSFLNGCGSSSQPPPPPPPVADFSIVVTPASVSTKVGGTSAPVTITLNTVNGFTGAVNMTVSGFPNGINSSPASPFTLTAGMPQLVMFSAPAAAGTFTVEFQGASGTLSHSANATLTVTPPQSPYLVSATYYPWYDASSFEFNVDCYNDTLRGELLPPGAADSRKHSEDVVTQQIAWSTAAGVNVWDLEWVMPNDSLDSTIQNTILTNPHIGDLRFAIFYDYAIRFNVDLNVTPDKIATIVSDFQYLAAHYFSHPSYLKVGQGRTVVFFYFSAALNPVSEIQQMVASIRTAMAAAGVNIYLIGDEYNALAPPDPTRVSNWDGIFGYEVDLHYSGYSDHNGFLALHSAMYSEYQAVAKQLGVDFIPSVTPGFNDRATRRICANDPALPRRTSAAAAEGSMFDNFLKDLALPYANNTHFKMVHITTFNEWHEDSQIEPSVVTGPTTTDTSATGRNIPRALWYQGYGTTYLDILRNAIACHETTEALTATFSPTTCRLYPDTRNLLVAFLSAASIKVLANSQNFSICSNGRSISAGGSLRTRRT